MPRRNQFSSGPPRKPFKRRDDQVTAKLIMQCLLSVFIGAAALVMLINWAAG